MDPVEGYIVQGATGPSSTITVKLPDEARPIEVAGWLPRATASTTEYPQAGDTALVAESDRGRLWLVGWITE
jgi:hypothetical protein